MCGVAGFFVGCDITKGCAISGEPCSLVKNSRVLQDWHEKASVRRSPRRVLYEEDVQRHMFPRHLAPVAAHPVVEKQGAEIIDRLLTNHLFRYLDFTYKLEMIVVNEVVKDIALNQAVFASSDELRLDAMKIYCDEAYHALFSYDLLVQIKELSQCEPILPKMPRFLRELNKMIREVDTEAEANLIKLIFVIVSETLITSSLTQIGKEEALPDGVRKTILDHATDEARHHVFFSSLLFSIWPKLGQRERQYILQKVPKCIFAFIEPDREAIIKELEGIGLSKDNAVGVVSETYTEKKVVQYARQSAAKTLRYVSQLDGYQDNSVREAFEEVGLAA